MQGEGLNSEADKKAADILKGGGTSKQKKLIIWCKVVIMPCTLEEIFQPMANILNEKFVDELKQAKAVVGLENRMAKKGQHMND